MKDVKSYRYYTDSELDEIVEEVLADLEEEIEEQEERETTKMKRAIKMIHDVIDGKPIRDKDLLTRFAIIVGLLLDFDRSYSDTIRYVNDFITIEEIAKYLEVSPRTVYRMIANNSPDLKLTQLQVVLLAELVNNCLLGVYE